MASGQWCRLGWVLEGLQRDCKGSQTGKTLAAESDLIKGIHRAAGDRIKVCLGGNEPNGLNIEGQGGIDPCDRMGWGVSGMEKAWR